MTDRRTFLKAAFGATASIGGAPAVSSPAGEKSLLSVTGDWRVTIAAGSVSIGGRSVPVPKTGVLEVPPPTMVQARDEKHDSLPLYDPQAAPWTRGVRLKELVTFETTAPDLLIPDSLAVKVGPGDAARFAVGKDYAIEPRWATLGRVPGGLPAQQAVWIDYDCGWNRLDSVVVSRNGSPALRVGRAHNATPHPPDLMPGDTLVANLWIPGQLARLSADNIYPVEERTYTRPRHKGGPLAASLLPATWVKLRSGAPLHILAWGDSVTDGGQASDPAHQYQSRFIALLQRRFPRAKLRLTTAAWGGRTSDNFLNEPLGTRYNFDHAVLEQRPDLVVMEFVNDAWMTPEVVETKYSHLLKRFQEAGVEWAILTPHYVRPDWMGASTPRISADPRPYVAGLRQFASRHKVALADASLRWGHLLAEGIPYVTLLSNSINHPDDRGHEMFADALMELFE